MKITMMLFLLAGLGLSAQTQDEYVCTPCDEKVHGSSGTCEACGMPLVKKSSIRFSNITAEQVSD